MGIEIYRWKSAAEGMPFPAHTYIFHTGTMLQPLVWVCRWGNISEDWGPFLGR